MIEDAIRSFIWGIVSVFLTLADWVYDIINTVIAIDISSNNTIWYFYGFGLVFISFAVTIRLFFVLAKKTARDEDRIDSGFLIKRIIAMFLVIALVPTLFMFQMGIPNAVNNIFKNTITYGERLTPSTSILTSIAQSPLSGDIKDMKGSKSEITISMIDKKLNKEKDGDYIYFKGYGELFFTLIMAGLVALALFNIFRQVMDRWFLNLLRLIIGFIPISGMVDPDDDTCSLWTRDILSDMVTQTFSVICLQFIFAIVMINSVANLNGIIKLFLFWAGIMSVGKIGNFIAKYLKASDLAKPGSIGTAIAGMAGYGMARGAQKLAGAATKYAGGTALTTGAFGVQKAGQALGGKSMSQMGYGGRPHGSSTNKNSENFGSPKANSHKSSSSYSNDKSVIDRNPIDKQNSNYTNARSYDGVNNNDLKSKNMQDDIGSRPSNKYPPSDKTIDIKANDSKQERANTLDKGKNIDSDNKRQPAKSDNRLSREDTLSRRFADYGKNNKGFKGALARGASNAGSHLYRASANRYGNSTARKVKQKITTPATLGSLNSTKNNRSDNSSSAKNNYQRKSAYKPANRVKKADKNLGRGAYEEFNG